MEQLSPGSAVGAQLKWEIFALIVIASIAKA
jgi:hypothetical protein